MTNPGKKINIIVDGVSYKRLTLKTHVISRNDTLQTVIDRYAKPQLQSKDLLLISERIIAIMEGRSYPLSDIHPGYWARTLYPFVMTHPGGIGLKNPYTMQLAIQEAGVLRILLAALVALITKPFGIKGLFYIVAGHNINAIDGPCDYTLPPGNTSAKLGPKNPQKTAVEIAKHFNCEVAVIDANDYGVRVMGYSKNVDPSFVEKVFIDNPFGQCDEQTPLAIVRRAAD